MFKALIVLFVTSNVSPMGMVTGEFPDRFNNLETCEAFAVKKRELLSGKTMLAAPEGPSKVKVIGSEISCVRDTGGMDA